MDEAFKLLRPFCVDVAKNPLQLERLQKLKSELCNLRTNNPEACALLFDYIAFPLQLNLRHVTSTHDHGHEYDPKADHEPCLDCIFDILEMLVSQASDGINGSKLIPSILSESFLLINRPPGTENIVASNSVIITVTKFVMALLENLNNGRELAKEDHRSLKTTLLDHQPILAQMIYALLRCLHKRRIDGNAFGDDDTNQLMEENVLRCLDAILELDQKLHGDFLPGVLSGLAEFVITLCSNVVSPREQLIKLCMELWTKAAIVGNYVSSEKSDEWRRNAALQLSKVFDRLSSIMVAHKWTTVRCSIFTTAVKMLTVAERKMSILNDCKKRLIEVIAVSLADDQSNSDSMDIPSIMNHCEDMVDRLLFSHCSRLSRLSRSPLSTEQQTVWRCLLGYLRLLGPQGVSDFLLIDENKEALVLGIITSLEFGVISSEPRPSRDVPEELMDLTTLFDFRRPIPLAIPSDYEAQKLVKAVVKELAQIEDTNLLFEYLYQQCQSTHCGPRAMFITNLLHTSLPQDSPPLWPDILSSFIDIHLDRLRKLSSLSAVEVYLNLEGLGHCALNLKGDFQSILVSAFYVVLSLLRHSDYKDSVWSTLFDFAVALNHRTVLDMIVSNIDYLSSSLCLRLRRSSLFPDSAAVLTALLDLLPWESLDTIRGAVMETLTTIDQLAVDPSRRDIVCSLLKVLERFCVFITSKCPSERLEASGSENSSKNMTSDEAHDETKPSPPWYISFIVDILHRIRSWTLAEGAYTRLASLDVLNKGLSALADYEDSLLPMVHQNWNPVLARLDDVVEQDQVDGAIIVGVSAFQVLITMASTSKDFICRRFCDEAWPRIRKILLRYSPESRQAGALIYSQSMSYRLQLTMLTHLGEICRNIGTSQEFNRGVEEVCRLYASEETLPALRQVAMRCLNDLGSTVT